MTAREVARVAWVWAQSWKGEGDHYKDTAAGRQPESLGASELARRLLTLPAFRRDDHGR